MEAISPVFAALGVSGFDLLDDLADWLDGGCDPTTIAEQAGRANRWGDHAMRSAGNSAGREG